MFPQDPNWLDKSVQQIGQGAKIAGYIIIGLGIFGLINTFVIYFYFIDVLKIRLFLVAVDIIVILYGVMLVYLGKKNKRWSNWLYFLSGFIISVIVLIFYLILR